MKKILCLIDTLGSGGAERQMVGLSVLLKKKGYDVELAVYHKDNFYASLARSGGVDPVILPVNNNQWSKLIAVRNFIKKKGGFDCVIGYKEGANAIGCLLKLMGVKYKLLVSDRITTQVLTRSNRIRFNLYRLADYIVPNSYSEGEFIAKHYSCLSFKIFPITNFTDTTLFHPVKHTKKDIITILTAARVSKQKNILNYIDAIFLLNRRGITNVHFDWYGRVENGENEYAEQCKFRIQELGLEDVVRFYPATSNIVVKYQECDFFCLPSSYEGFPNVVCEAMSCGKPIACSRVCDNPRIVNEEENGVFFNPDSIEDIADKLEYLIKMDEDKLTQWGERSRELAVERFSEEAFVNKYIKLIEA